MTSRQITLAIALVVTLVGSYALAKQDPKRAAMPPQASADTATATFAGGCFWCMEPPFDVLDGVVATTSGYIGGESKNPTYEQVSTGRTGHTEAVQVLYDPDLVSYEELLAVFWRNIDPTDAGGQFCDRGSQYRAGIFFHDEAQKSLAEKSRQTLQASNVLSKDVVTEVTEASEFYPAEEYHQDYYLKNKFRYKLYRTGCGRDRRLQAVWGAS